MKIEKHMSRRYVLFAMVMLAAFAVLIFGLYRLQITNAEQYQTAAGSQKVLTRRLTGMRGMITDADSVVLAMSEPTYNITFYRTDKQNSARIRAFTASIIGRSTWWSPMTPSWGVKSIFERIRRPGLPVQFRQGRHAAGAGYPGKPLAQQPLPGFYRLSHRPVLL